MLSALKLIPKAGVIGGAIYFVLATDVSDGLVVKRLETTKITLPKKISSIDDIELYESRYGCKYAFTEGGQDTYNARGFVENSKPNRPDWGPGLEWKDWITYSAEEQKSKCEKGENILLVYESGKGFKPKT